jgi:hypothetical protein
MSALSSFNESGLGVHFMEGRKLFPGVALNHADQAYPVYGDR